MICGIFRFFSSSIFFSIPGTLKEAKTKSGLNDSTLSISIDKSGPNLGKVLIDPANLKNHQQQLVDR